MMLGKAMALTDGYLERARRALGSKAPRDGTSKGLARAYHVGALTITQDGKTALSGEVDGLTIWDLRSHRPQCSIDSAMLKKELGTNLGTPQSIVMTPDGSGIACTYAESSYVAWWDVKRGTLKPIKLYDVEGSYGALIVTPDGRRVLLNNYQAEMLYAVDLKSGRGRGKGINVVTNAASIMDAALTPDQQYLAARDWAGILLFWDGRSGTYDLIHEIDTGHEDYNGRVYISPNGHYFGIAEPQPRVWNARTGQLTLELSGGGAIAFTPDNRSLIFQDYISEDSFFEVEMRICDIETGNLIASLEGTDSLAPALAVSPDGKVLMSGHIDGTIRFWNLETYKLVDAIGINGNYWA